MRFTRLNAFELRLSFNFIGVDGLSRIVLYLLDFNLTVAIDARNPCCVLNPQETKYRFEDLSEPITPNFDSSHAKS